MNNTISAKERRYARRTEREMNRLLPTVAYLEGRLYEQLKATGLDIACVFGIMHGETEPSAFISVSEPRKADGIEWEHPLLETHKPADVLHYFGLEE